MSRIVSDDSLAFDAAAEFDFFSGFVDYFVRQYFELLSDFVELNEFNYFDIMLYLL